jgi:hypothetical protein
MKHKAYIALVFASLAVALLLMCGYGLRFSTTGSHVSANSGTLVTDKEVDLVVGEGRLAIFWAKGGSGNVFITWRQGWNWRWRARFRAVNWGRAIWDFDAHRLPATMVGTRGSSGYLIGCPLWCLILPNLILPGIWMRKRLRDRRQVRGFDVQPPPQQIAHA